VNFVTCQPINEARQNMGTDIDGRGIWNLGEELGGRDHDSGKDQITERMLGFLDKAPNHTGVIDLDDAATRRIGDPINTDGSRQRVTLMILEHASEIDSGEDVGIKDPEQSFGFHPLAMCMDGAGAAQEDPLFRNGNPYRAAIGLQEFEDRLPLSVHIDENIVNARRKTEVQPYFEQRLTTDGDQTLRNRVGKWT